VPLEATERPAPGRRPGGVGLSPRLGQADLLEANIERTQQSHEQPDDRPEHPDAAPKLQDFRLEAHRLPIQDIRGDDGPMLAA